MTNPAYRTEMTAIPHTPDARAIRVLGRVTHEEAPELRKGILGVLSKTSASKMVLELGGVEHMDTAGAAVLAEALKLGQTRGLRVLLCSPSEPVLRIFRLAGFEEVLAHCCSDPEETRQRLLE